MADLQRKRLLVFTAMHEEMHCLLKELDIDVGENKNAWDFENEKVQVRFVCPKRDPTHNVSSVGTMPATLTTQKYISEFSPNIVLNAGTAGGFVSRGGEIGKVYACTKSLFHDRRIPLPGFTAYGVDEREAPLSAKVAEMLNLPTG